MIFAMKGSVHANMMIGNIQGIRPVEGQDEIRKDTETAYREKINPEKRRMFNRGLKSSTDSAVCTLQAEPLLEQKSRV